ncbi:MAG TPA: substrate-binding domain-containing protein [Steroidobacteraceae bacterium]|nr:substrate-binding domain-containing protein [Steroidobacteraceae bacterium]
MARMRTATQQLSATVLAGIISMSAAHAARADSVEIFAAGSLRATVGELAQEAHSTFNIDVQASFGGSGLMRERIEKGAKPDLFLSADLGSPRKLEAAGRTVVPVIAFARNRMCIVSRPEAKVTAANLIDRLLAPEIRVKTSTPIVDPAGDYAWAIFDRIEAMRPGAGATLKAKAQALMKVSATPATPNQSAMAALFAAHQIDLAITYCSGVPALSKEVPRLANLVIPPALDPHPVDGVAVLSARPEVMRLVLLLLSEKGQAIIERAGLVPIASVPRMQP